MTTPRPKRWSITIGGTLPLRKPGTLIERAMSAYALSMLGLRSAKGTSTVILTRVGLSCSTVLGTVVGLLEMGWRRSGRRWGVRRLDGPEHGGAVDEHESGRDPARAGARCVGQRRGAPSPFVGVAPPRLWLT